MPGNEAADKLYNFFDQEKLSLGQRNSQVSSASWPVVSNNLWVENQSQIGPAPNSDTGNHNIQHSDSAGGCVQQTPQTLYRKTEVQSRLRPEFGRIQFRNQELSSNGFIQEHQTLRNKHNHTQSPLLKDASEQLNLTSRGFSVSKQQRGNASEHIPALARASERLETIEAPITFDLLDQQQSMNNQQPGMSQPRPRQQPGFGDMPLWQQQYMLKQLQELQRQKQIQQLEQDGRYQNQLNQLSAFAKQAASDQLPAIVNGMPIPGSANYVWQNEPSGSDPRIPNSSQMFLVGNTNFAQRGGYSAVQGIPDGLLINEQGQVLRSVGLVPQQLDQPVYSAQNDSTRGAFNQYSHHQGIPQDRANALNKGNGNLEKPILQSMPLTNSLQGGQSSSFSDQVNIHDGASASRQGFQGKNIFGQVPFQGMSSGVHPGNSMQINSLSGNASLREFQGREQQAGWSGNLQERAASQFRSSQGMVSLDPTEKKILFSTDDNIWDTPGDKGASAGAGGYENSLERTENLSFPSIQSGTWSALMQSAVAEASSSDTGLQDEWSGLGFQKELSAVDQPIALGDSTRQKADWAGSNLQGASMTSRSAPLFDDGNMSQSGRTSNVHQSGTRNMYELSERLQQDAPYGSNQQALNDSGKWLDRSSQQKISIQGNHQVQPSRNAWARQIHSESADRTTNMAGDAHKTQGSWVHQHGVSSPNISSQHGNNMTGWNHINTLPARGDGASNINDSGNNKQTFQRNDLKMGMNLETDRGGGLMMANSYPNFTDGGGGSLFKGYANNCMTSNSGATNSVQDTNQQVLNSHHLNYQKQLTNSPVNRRDDAIGYNQNPLGAQVHEASMYNSDKGSGEAYDKKQEKSLQKEFSNDSYSSNQSQPTVTGGTGRENSWLSTSDSRPIANANQKSSNQALSQQIFQGSKGHGREFFGQPEFTSNSTSAMEKEHIPDFHGTEKGSASSDGSAGAFPQNRKPVKTCQNMLELFHSVDQSIEHVTQVRVSSADHNTSSVMPEAEGSDASVARQWQNQSTASQGFGLRLGPPSQRPPVANHALHSQNSLPALSGLNLRQMDSKVEERGQIWASPASSVQSLPHEMNQREHWDNSPNNSGQTSNETSQLNIEASGPGAFPSSLPHSRNQGQSQSMSRTSEKVMSNALRGMSNPPSNASNDRQNSRLRKAHGPYGEVVADQTDQVSLTGTSSRNALVASPSEDTSKSESWSQVRVSGQQFPVFDSVPVSRPSVMSGKSPQVDFSTMLHHVLANASQQQPTGGQTNKLPPNFSKPASPSNSNMEKTSFPAQNVEDRGAIKVGNSPGFSVCLAGSQGSSYGQEQAGRESSWKQIPEGKVDPTLQRAGASLGQESVMKHPPETRFRSSDTLPAHPHQQEIDRGRYGRESTPVSQRENSSFNNLATSARDIEAFGRNLRPGNQNYSLLHQVQAMRSGENDLDTRGGKRFKGADADADAQQIANRPARHMLDGCNVVVRDPLHSGQNSAVQHSSYSSADGRMLSFSSERREDQNANTAPQSALGAVPSHDMVTYGQNERHNHLSQHNTSSNRPEMTQINPKMAPTWFGRYGTFRHEQILPVPNAVKVIPQQFTSGEGSDGLLANSSKEQIDTVDASQSNITNMVPPEYSISQPVPLEFSDQPLAVLSPKKRKSEKLMLLPWHKEILDGSKRLKTVSMSERDWAQAANRLVEKMEDEADLADDAQPIIRPRRRLIYTSQLMQQLLCPAPAEILSAKATSDYETVTYSVAKVALGEACGLISSSGSDTQSLIVNDDGKSGKLKTSGREPTHYYSRIVEDFVGRAKKLESDLLSLDKKASVIDIRVECQDLERFSVINRFAKFHGKSQTDAAETSSSSSAAAVSQKPIPQRYVTAHPMPRNLPGGVHCLSL